MKICHRAPKNINVKLSSTLSKNTLLYASFERNRGHGRKRREISYTSFLQRAGILTVKTIERPVLQARVESK